MIKGKILHDKLKQDISNIILNSKTNMIFLIGENSTGKSEIGEMLKDKIIVLDNYTGTFDNIPKDNKVLIITHNINLLLQAKRNTKVIITRTDDLYISTDCDVNSYGDIIEIMYNKDLLSVFLNNSISGDWSELNELFLQDYIANNKLTLTPADKLILKTIEDFKQKA